MQSPIPNRHASGNPSGIENMSGAFSN